MVSYRPVGKQFRTTCQSAIEQLEKMEDVSTHESLMTDFVNTSRSRFFFTSDHDGFCDKNTDVRCSVLYILLYWILIHFLR